MRSGQKCRSSDVRRAVFASRVAQQRGGGGCIPGRAMCSAGRHRSDPGAEDGCDVWPVAVRAADIPFSSSDDMNKRECRVWRVAPPSEGDAGHHRQVFFTRDM